VSHAGHRIGARFAAVTFGNHAEAVVKPMELPSEVTVRAADGGSEAFDEAVAAIDGVLHLTSNRAGAKVLIVVTDGELVRPNEMAKAQKWLDKLRAGGTLVIQVGYAYTSPLGKGVEIMKIKKPTVDDLVKAIVRGLQTSMTSRG
jgi:cell division GTPase FtsZ